MCPAPARAEMPRIWQMLVSTRGLLWNKVHLVMFTVYLDDSGTALEHPVAVATALIIPSARILALESEWQTFAGKEGFTYFHTSAFVAHNLKSEFADWDDKKRQRVFDRVRQICRKYGTICFSFAVKKDDYDAVVTGDWREYFGKYHYSWAIRHVMQFVDNWRIGNKISVPLEYVFSWLDTRAQRLERREVELIMSQFADTAADRGHGGEYDNYGFRHPEDIAGLQCVDQIAWVYYRIAQQQLAGKPMHPFAQQALAEYQKAKEWIMGAFLTREKLQEWFDVEIKNQESQALLEKWKARHS